MPIKKDRFEARDRRLRRDCDLTAMLELRQGSFGNPFSHRQGVRRGINSPSLWRTHYRCRSAQMRNQDLRAVFPCQRECSCCAATSSQNIGRANPTSTRISAGRNLAGNVVTARLPVAWRASILCEAVPPGFSFTRAPSEGRSAPTAFAHWPKLHAQARRNSRGGSESESRLGSGHSGLRNSLNPGHGGLDDFKTPPPPTGRAVRERS